LQHRQRGDRVDGRIAQWKLLCIRPQEADLGSGFRAHRARQHRLGDVDAERHTVGTRGARQRRGDVSGSTAHVEGDAAGRNVEPVDGRLPYAQQLARQVLHVVVEHGTDPRGPRRLDGTGVLRRPISDLTVFQQVEVALADVGVSRRIDE